MCDGWAKKDGRIRVIHKENGGLSSARNVGIDNARGEYISFVDSDDFLDSHMYERLYEGITRASNIGISGVKFLSYKSGKSEIYNKHWDTKEDVLIKAADFGILTLTQKICHAATNKLYRIEIFAHLRFREGIVNEDVLFSHDLAKVIEDLKLDMWDLNYYGYYYRMRPDSICHSAVPIMIPYIENLRTILREGGSPEYKAVAAQLYHHALYRCYNSLLNDFSDNGERLRNDYFVKLHEQVKILHYKDVLQDNTKASLYDRLSFLTAKYYPRLYMAFNRYF